MAPKWKPHKLAQHHRKRTTKDAGCFEDLLRINPRTMSELKYKERSEQVVANAWGKYRGEGRNIARGEYYDEAMYFVDDDLVVAITDVSGCDFITCFHEHFGRRHVSPASIGTVGQRRLQYKEHLQFDEQGGLIRNVRRIRGV
jgi:hypothetical protein